MKRPVLKKSRRNTASQSRKPKIAPVSAPILSFFEEEVKAAANEIKRLPVGTKLRRQFAVMGMEFSRGSKNLSACRVTDEPFVMWYTENEQRYTLFAIDVFKELGFTAPNK